MSRLILHAPGISTGGGLVLLRALFSANNLPKIIANLDVRALSQIVVPAVTDVEIVKPDFFSRLSSELRLRKLSQSGDFVFCFNGMPPLFPCTGHVSVFVQNRLNLGEGSALSFFKRNHIKTFLKQFIFYLLRGNVNEYVVQTPSMNVSLSKWLGDKVKPIRVLPFWDCPSVTEPFSSEDIKQYDFLYVADGLPHKNHDNLVLAWSKMAQEGLRPSLMLTLGSRDTPLLDMISKAIDKYDLLIHNSGDLSREEVFRLYEKSRAFVCPSTCESFGLPLLEATKFGLPIVASEMDFVRDVSTPIETFDPNSPVSISRAIKRYLGLHEDTLVPFSPDDFFEKLLK